MYAVVEINKGQYKVAIGDIITVERLKAHKDKVVFDRVLLVSDKETTIGRPYIDGAKVSGSILGEAKSSKTTAFKYRRRKGYHRKVGHRQKLTRVKIEEIKL